MVPIIFDVLKFLIIQWRAQKYLESVSWSVIMIVISNLVMSIAEREPRGFRITVKQRITTA